MRLLGAIGHGRRGRLSNAWNTVCACVPIYNAHPSEDVERNHVAARVSTLNERDVVPSATFLEDGRAKIDTYFTRVYNPVWTNPDGFSMD